MRTIENYKKPAEEPAEEVLLQLPQAPRTVKAGGIRLSILWRILVFLLSIVFYGYIATFNIYIYIRTASFLSWVYIISLAPICLGLIPWWLITSFKAKLRSFNYCKKIYQNGTATLGTINTLTRISGHAQECHIIEHSKVSSRDKIRVDYTFTINQSVKTGTATLSEQSVEFLGINTEVCVIYMPDNPSENMLFPIPGNEFFDYLRK